MMGTYSKLGQRGVRGPAWAFAVLLLIVIAATSGCLKSSYQASQCSVRVTFQYNFAEGVDAVDGSLLLTDINTRMEYKTTVTGSGAVQIDVPRGFYRIQFEGIAKSSGRLARVVALVEEQSAAGARLELTLIVLSQWL